MITLAALNQRAESGVGQYVDFSMAEALSASLPEALLEYQMTGEEPAPSGNDDSYAFPHDVYKCAGDDRWIAIEVHDYTQWRALCAAIGRGDWLEDRALYAARARRELSDEIDAAIAAWTSTLDDWQAFQTLQGAGVPCGPSLDMGRLHAERQLNEGGYLTAVQYPDDSQRILPTLPWRMDGQRTNNVKPAPTLGQDSDYVYRQLLGLTPKEITALTDEQVIY